MGTACAYLLPADLQEMLARAGLEIVAEHGVRVFSDYVALESPAGRNVLSNIRVGIDAGSAPRVFRDCALHSADRSPFSRVIQRGNRTVTPQSPHSTLNSPMVRPTVTGKFALGLGLTNECNLACSFCYRDPARTDRLSLEQVRSVMESLPVRSVNLGTGENGMHPQFREILSYLRTLPVKLTITSNGHSAAVLTDDELRAFHDIEFSLDYPTEPSRTPSEAAAIGL